MRTFDLSQITINHSSHQPKIINTRIEQHDFNHPPPQTEDTTSELLIMNFNNTHFTLPKHLAPKGSILHTKEPHIDLTFTLPIYLGSLLPELFSTYLT